MPDIDLDAAVAVTLVINTTNDHIQFARLTTTAVAAKVGFDYDAIEDLRMAVSELCGTVIAHATTRSELTLTCRADPHGIDVTGRAPAADGIHEVEPDELSEQVLSAVTNEHTYAVVGGEVQFTMHRSMHFGAE
jgi:hypothetical protein